MDYAVLTTKSGKVWSTLPIPKLARYVAAQAVALFPDGTALDADALETCAARALEIVARAWPHIAVPGYTRDGSAVR